MYKFKNWIFILAMVVFTAIIFVLAQIQSHTTSYTENQETKTMIGTPFIYYYKWVEDANPSNVQTNWRMRNLLVDIFIFGLIGLVASVIIKRVYLQSKIKTSNDILDEPLE